VKTHPLFSGKRTPKQVGGDSSQDEKEGKKTLGESFRIDVRHPRRLLGMQKRPGKRREEIDSHGVGQHLSCFRARVTKCAGPMRESGGKPETG